MCQLVKAYATMVQIVVDGKAFLAREGESVLRACLENGVFIPNLCFMKSREHPHASCRLCFVEIDGIEGPVASCASRVREGLVVQTDTAAVRRLQKSAFRLLMSAHHLDPKHCPVKGSCQLIRIARHLDVALKPKHLEFLSRDVSEEVDFIFFTHYPFRCVLCGKCVHVCERKNGHSLLTFIGRGFETVLAFFGHGDAAAPSCRGCLACASVCPTAALVPKMQNAAASHD